MCVCMYALLSNIVLHFDNRSQIIWMELPSVNIFCLEHDQLIRIMTVDVHGNVVAGDMRAAVGVGIF